MRSRKVLIVGGGSAGWITAAYLEAALRDDPRAKVEIKVVESPSIPRIGVGNVIGHSESLRSPYHRERVERLKTQTHGDWSRTSMRTYRARLADKGTC